MEKKFSVKEFFKSTAFKCIYVLLAIVLVCGVLLAFCNDLFEVTAEEKLNRVLGNIYPDGNVEEIIFDADHETDLETEFENGAVDQVYLMDDGNYLIHAYGTGGFGGNVYMWVVVEMSDGAISGIGKTQIDTNDTTGETYLNKIPGAAFDFYSENYADGENFDVQDIKSEGLTGGATMSMTGATNAVNTALEFVRTQLLGEVIVPDEPGPFEKFSYYSETYISDDTTVELAEDGTSVVFGIVANPYVFTSTFRMSITVDNTGTITAMTVPATPADGNGSTDGFENSMDENVLNASLYIGKTADEILDYLGGEPKDDFTYEDLKNNAVADNTITSGATYSNFIVTYAALFAASNYQNGYVMALENSVQYTQYIDMENTTVNVADGTVTYNVVTTSYGHAQAFNITIIVNADGTIADFTITHNGSTDATFEGYMNDDILSGAMFETKTAAEILDMFKEPTGENGEFVKNDLEDSSLASGATDSTYKNAGYSNFLCVYSALFAASNYEVYPMIEEARLNLEMSNIYGESVSVEAVSLEGLTATVGNGTVNAVYSVAGTGDYIVSATGNGGFEDGTVTCWIVVETENGAVSGIKNVVIASNDKQSYIGYITDATLGHFTDAFNGSDFAVSDWKSNNITGGATASTTAIVNSVNSAMNFVSANLISGGENA